jgi:predicted O-methyltransferase YrrM
LQHGAKINPGQMPCRRAREQFTGVMAGLSRINFEAFAANFDLSNFESLYDVGGATGLLCMEIAGEHPHLYCVSFDLPRAEPIAGKHIAAAGLGDRIDMAAGDLLKTRCPRWMSSRCA